MKLRTIRFIFSTIIFIFFSYIFFASNKFSIILGNILNYFQFVPSILKFISTGFSLLVLGFILILILTFLFGRIYCSFLCPLGIFQDFIIFISQKFRKKFKFITSFNWIRYSILVIVLFFSIIGIFIFLDSLDPYSIFGRIFTNIFKPVFIFITNKVILFLKENKIYLNLFYKIHNIKPSLFLFSIFFLLIIIIFSIFRGRLYCNTICPVGTLLGYISKYSIFNITLDNAKCTSCYLCEKICKSGCIDSKNKKLDLERCVSCFSCLDLCPKDAMNYSKRNLVNKKEINYSRREFIKYLFPASILTFTLIGAFIRKPFSSIRSASIKNNKSLVIPPGSFSLNNFINSCTSCHYCVSSCPTKVLKPTLFFGTMQPTLDFSFAYCDYECNICSQVCPSGAIKPIGLGIKKKTKIGLVNLDKQSCIVYKYNLDCGACAEHCPTNAVYMVPYNDVYGPEINQDICIGCGACEYVCPSTPIKAITVKGNEVHQIIKEVKKLQKNEEKDESPSKTLKEEKKDFPF